LYISVTKRNKIENKIEIKNFTITLSLIVVEYINYCIQKGSKPKYIAIM